MDNNKLFKHAKYQGGRISICTIEVNRPEGCSVSETFELATAEIIPWLAQFNRNTWRVATKYKPAFVRPGEERMVGLASAVENTSARCSNTIEVMIVVRNIGKEASDDT